MMSRKIKERGELDVISHVESMGKQRVMVTRDQ